MTTNEERAAYEGQYMVGRRAGIEEAKLTLDYGGNIDGAIAAVFENWQLSKVDLLTAHMQGFVAGVIGVYKKG